VGWRDIYINGTEDGKGLVNLLRFYSMVDGHLEVTPVNLYCLAPPWVRDGTVMTMLVWLPLFFPNNTMPLFNFDWNKPDDILMFLAPFRVSGAVTVNIGGSDYDCWRADIILPSGLSNYNITQFSYTVYFERNSGILLKAKADMEMKMPLGGNYVPIGYHKTWTLSNVGGNGIPSPIEWIELVNRYSFANIGAGERKTLDSSFFNGGSVTIECNESVSLQDTYTYTRHTNTSINGYPIVKLMSTEVYRGVPTPPYGFNATLNFYYTPSELSVRGAKATDFTIYYYYYNESSGSYSWVPLNTTVDSDGRVVSANITIASSNEFFSGVFALVAGPLTIWDILGPGGLMLLWYLLLQSIRPMGGLMLPILGGIVALLVLIIAVAAVILARRHKYGK
jgi:hypothetical protein